MRRSRQRLIFSRGGHSAFGGSSLVALKLKYIKIKITHCAPLASSTFSKAELQGSPFHFDSW